MIEGGILDFQNLGAQELRDFAQNRQKSAISLQIVRNPRFPQGHQGSGDLAAALPFFQQGW